MGAAQKRCFTHAQMACKAHRGEVTGRRSASQMDPGPQPFGRVAGGPRPGPEQPLKLPSCHTEGGALPTRLRPPQQVVDRDVEEVCHRQQQGETRFPQPPFILAAGARTEAQSLLHISLKETMLLTQCPEPRTKLMIYHQKSPRIYYTILGIFGIATSAKGASVS